MLTIQWSSINQSGGNWFKVEEMVRNKAVNTTLQITVGTLGVMTLEGKEIYLDPDSQKLPVPRYLYKIITTPSSGNSDVYVFLNNPHGDVKNIKAEIDEVFGEGIIELSGDYVEVKNGYTFKMPYKEFLKVVNKAFKGFVLPKSMKAS